MFPINIEIFFYCFDFGDSSVRKVGLPNGVFTDSDKAIIEACFKEKGWRSRRILREFPNYSWSYSSVHYIVEKIRNIGSLGFKQWSEYLG